MNRLCVLLSILILTACKDEKTEIIVPTSNDSSNIIVPGFSEAELNTFKKLHGSEFDLNSKSDKIKMDEIRGITNAPIKPVVPESVTPVRERIINSAESLLGLRETDGSNRSEMIDKMNQNVGAPLGSPWCASWNAWNYKQAKVTSYYPKSAWSPDWVASPTWTRSKGGKTPLPGDAFGIYFPSKGRISHTGLVSKWGDSVETLEGNTGPNGTVAGSPGDREGDGSYKKRRLRTQIYSVRNWIGD